jgi:hypothetical protein
MDALRNAYGSCAFLIIHKTGLAVEMMRRWNLECPDSNYSKFPEALRTVLNRRFPRIP